VEFSGPCGELRAGDDVVACESLRTPYLVTVLIRGNQKSYLYPLFPKAEESHGKVHPPRTPDDL